MRSFFKSLANDAYSSFVQDEYLDKLQESEIYQIVNRGFRRNSQHEQQHNKHRRLSIGSLPQQAYELIESCLLMNPQRQFRILGYDPSIQSVNLRMKTAKQHLEEVAEIMQQNYPKYQHMIQKSLGEIDNIKGMEEARKKSVELRSRLKHLEQATYRSKRVTELNIKMKNLKSILNILQQIPNIKKMTLIELKGIKQRKIKHNQKLKHLDCLRGLSTYINKVVGEQLAGVLKVLEECLIHKFEQQSYQNALKNFIITEHQKIKYERMLIRLVEKEIRRYSSQMGTEIFLICQFYTKIILNLHAVFRWHRENEEQQTQRIRRLSKECQQADETQEGTNHQRKQLNQIEAPSISINIAFVTRSIAEAIDECLKGCIIEKMHNPQSSCVYIQTIYLTIRMSQIVEKFSGRKLEISFEEIKNQYLKLCKQTKEKALHDLLEALDFQDKNDWNRFPVPSDYSHAAVDKAMYQIWRQKQSPEYQKMMRIFKKLESSSEDQQEEEETWEIQPIQIEIFQKFQKHQQELAINYPEEVIICQSSLTLLKYIQKCIQISFYFPIQYTYIMPIFSEKPDPLINQSIPLSIRTALNIFSFYLFYIFNSLISSQLKVMFFRKLEEVETIEAKYHTQRLLHQYSNLNYFIKEFPRSLEQKYRKNLKNIGRDRQSAELGINTSHNSQNDRSGMIKCRVVACESSPYILTYISHMINLCKNKSIPFKYSQEIDTALEKFNKISDQLTEIVYTEVVPRMFSLKKTISLIQNIKWSDDVESNIKQYAQILIKMFKDFYFKMKSVNKGVIPIKIGDKIFGLYWKTQLTAILKTFIMNFNPKKNSSFPMSKLEFFIDHLYEQILQMFSANQLITPHNKSNSKQFINQPYIKIKQIFQICLERDWEPFFEHIRGSLDRYEYVYGISIGLLGVSEVGMRIDEQSRRQRKKQIEEYIVSNFKKTQMQIMK